MKITISGRIGAGKSSVAKELSKRLGLRYYSAGDYMRGLAREKGKSLIEFSRIAEENNEYDKSIDNWLKELGEKEDDFIVDARLGYFFIPDSFKIFLDIDEREAAERIFKQGREENKGLGFEEILKDIRLREKSQKLRYKKYYNIDFPQLERFDLIIDTKGKTVENIVEEIIKALPK
ncbi:MAG: CMP/dCMP kinase [Candidatus Woesearchaeota archaeon]|nr:CMP/dCMP kinase [Candidatus Woesearchaeota archaeon]